MEQPGLKKVIGFVVDMGNTLENESREEPAKDQDENRGQDDRNRDAGLVPYSGIIHLAVFNPISFPEARRKPENAALNPGSVI
jgi:hypothetical protein